MTKAFFVFQVQPVSPNLPSFVVHVYPSNTGKADSHILNLLHQISSFLLKEHTKTIAYASDGDNFISSTHESNIINHYKQGYFNSISLDKPLVISDPLHILKRSRYHLVKKIHETDLPYKLNLPSMVFRDDLPTKMHDRLPILMFQLRVFEKMTEHKLYNYSMYCLPSILFLTFLSYNIDIEDRILFLYMTKSLCERLYYNIYQSPIINNFSMKSNIIRDLLSTVCTFIDILTYSQNAQLHLNRIGTYPLEHTFGVVRMRYKDHHNAQRFLSEVNKLNALRKIREEMIYDAVKHHELQFGKIIINKPVKYDNSDIIKYVDSLVYEAKYDYCNTDYEKVHQYFIKLIKESNSTKDKCYLYKSSDVLLSPRSNTNIQKRQFSGYNTERCRWGNEEIQLLIQLNQDFKGNISMISKYFPRRTPRSVEEKLNKIKINKNKKHY